ncbi:hypothetical protein DRO54_04855 [Candidatus Bathyarchaeota archaeon]|nr:MAG: hypothetical protein DRO54_04855 [Candidatus Bathyarchaeota archaeon]
MPVHTAMLKPCAKSDIDPDRPMSEQQVCLYSKSTGKLLGRHPNEDSAKKQEMAIQISKHAENQDRVAQFTALQTYLLYEVARRVIDYAKGKRLQKPAERVWTEIFKNRLKVTTRGPLKRGQVGGQYKIEGTLLFVNGDTKRPILLTLVAAFWKFKVNILLQLREKNKAKPLFSILDRDLQKVVKQAKVYISNNLILPEINEGDRVLINILPHKGRIGIVQSYQTFARRALVQLEPLPNDNNETKVNIWLDRNQVTLMTTNYVTKQFQAAIDSLLVDHPDLAEKLGKSKENYIAKTELEKMIGSMTREQSGIWLDKKQMHSIVIELKKKGITEPKDGAYDDIAQLVGKLLDKLIPDAGDTKEEKAEQKKTQQHKNTDKNEKKSASQAPQACTQTVVALLQEAYSFSSIFTAQTESQRSHGIQRYCVSTASIKNGALLLGEDTIISYYSSKEDSKVAAVDISVVTPRSGGSAFDVVVIPALGDQPVRAVTLDHEANTLLAEISANGIAAAIFAKAEQTTL